MGKQSHRTLTVYLPLVALATTAVVGVPMLLVLWLRTSSLVSSLWLGTAIAVIASFLISQAGAALWKTRTDSRDILFSDLMLWGWVQRWRTERRLSAATDLLGLASGRPQPVEGGRLSDEQKTDLLTQLTSGLEARDLYTHGHSRRVARHAANIAKAMGLSGHEVAKIRAAGAMHDVGKVETPTAVLHKEGKLTDEEFAIIKRHPVDGASMVSTLKDDELTRMVRHHHERLDGTGYPDGLAGEAIPIGARVIAVADTFDAITSTRPYRHAHAHKKALDILSAEAGSQLDPDAVRAFCSCYSGRRPLVIWTLLANSRPRLVSLLGDGLSVAKASTVANAMTTAATAAVVGGVALAPLAATPAGASRAVADASSPSRTSEARAPGSASMPAARTGSGRPASPSPKPRTRGGRPSPPAPMDRTTLGVGPAQAALGTGVGAPPPPTPPTHHQSPPAVTAPDVVRGDEAPRPEDTGGRSAPERGLTNNEDTGKDKEKGLKEGKEKDRGEGKDKQKRAGEERSSGPGKGQGKSGDKEPKEGKGETGPKKDKGPEGKEPKDRDGAPPRGGGDKGAKDPDAEAAPEAGTGPELGPAIPGDPLLVGNDKADGKVKENGNGNGKGKGNGNAGGTLSRANPASVSAVAARW